MSKLPNVSKKYGRFYGLYQFTKSSWKIAGGVGLPSEASPAEQLKRAKILYGVQGPGAWPYCQRFF